MRKIIALGIMLLFLGMTISSTGFNLENQSVKPLSFGNTLYVGGNGTGNYTSIQDAIDNASDGDTVFVYNGTYYEFNITIDVSINLIGENRDTTVIEGNGTGSIVNLKADGVNISGFTIQNGSSPNIGAINIKIYRYNNISGNIIKNTEYSGIRTYYSDENIISGNIFIDSRRAIHLCRSDANTIRGNIIKNSSLDILLFSSDINNIFENQIEHGPIFLEGDSGFNNIYRNNIIPFFPIRGAYFGLDIYCLTMRNRWYNNYWNRPRILPKPIFGCFYYLNEHSLYIPWVTFYWHPAQEPYDIEV